MYMEVFKDIADKPNISYKELREKYFFRKIDDVLTKYKDALIIKKDGNLTTFMLNNIGEKLIEVIKEFPGLNPFYCEIFVDSMLNPKLQKEIEFVNCVLEDWSGNFLHPLGKDLFHAGRRNSIMYCYMATQAHTFDWLGHSLFMGHYDLVCRELRCILENLFFYYKLDFDSMTDTVEMKHKIIKEKESESERKGSRQSVRSQFKESGYSEWKKYYKLYSDLCEYIHVSSKISGKYSLEIAKGGFSEMLDICYDEILFKKCVDNWLQIVELSGKLMESLFDKYDIERTEFNPYFVRDFYFNKHK